MRKNKFLKTTVVAIFFILVFASAVQAIVNITYKNNLESNSSNGEILQTFSSNWQDDFNDESKIDTNPPGSGISENYVVDSGYASMINTYPAWTDPSWTKLKSISLTNTGGQPFYNYPLKITIEYDSDMQSDYSDIRFKHENDAGSWLSYWMEIYDTSEAVVWIKIPEVPIGSSEMYLFYGNSGAISQSDFYSVFSDWEEEWPNDEQVTYHLNNEGTWDADVCYGDGEFLVAWEEGQAYWPPYTWGFKQ